MRVGGGNERTKKIECTNPKNNIWKIRWDFVKDEDGTTFEEYTFKYKPSLEQIKEVIYKYYDNKTNNLITNGFVWKDIPVTLSTENQFNYKAAYDLAVQTGGITFPVKFKFGTQENPIYYVFDNLVDFTDFYTSALKYVNTVLNNGWDTKDNINWNYYKYDE